MKLGVVMDPIGGIKTYKDSTFAMLLAAQKRGLELHYMEQHDLFIEDGRAMTGACTVSVEDNTSDWYRLGEKQTRPLSDFDAVLMRKDPPFNMEYVHTTYILELAQRQGTLVINNPASLRDVNEKMIINFFPQCIAPTLVSRNLDQIRNFVRHHGEVVLKPLDSMGGASVFRTHKDDLNLNVIIETLTENESRFIMAQVYISAISEGDKRILLIDGEPVEYALARVPMAGETRGNLAAGGIGRGVELGPRDRWLCEQVGPVLKQMGLVFVGLDVIGDYLTEINVTSPTCIRELEAIYNIDIAGRFIELVREKVLAARSAA
ncbi:MAG: glutathione synthase [Gammaproteobacteria bacterium]|jgi:glutathione synthase